MAKPNSVHDVLIAGQGPAGYAAALYSARYQIRPVILGETFGGETATGRLIENYPGYPEIDGFDLMMKFREQAEKYEVPIVDENVARTSRRSADFDVTTKQGNKYTGGSSWPSAASGGGLGLSMRRSGPEKASPSARPATLRCTAATP